ncbi:MAG: hypothetical protein EKK48_14915 [Candidatus Melainabacteria bacterium]|nr:MAG: hypothetical protein EKK48_14915 [Candidatus Melainabacteria bacterium]
MPSKTATFKPKLDLTPYLDGVEIISVAVAYDGSLLVVSTTADKKDVAFGRVDNSFASFPKTRSNEPYSVAIMRFSSELIQNTIVSDVEQSYPIIQTFPDGSFLLVGSRCRNLPSGPELNAAVYGADGKLEHRFCAGDGIADVQISEHGEIWVSYFDEGVFGNFGWNEPIGSSGLNCFNRCGEIAWRFSAPEGLDEIADCYAMNVNGDDVWLCYYTDFAFVRIDKNKNKHVWKNDVCGAGALAVEANRVLLFGGYGEDKARCIVQTLSSAGDSKNKTNFSVQCPFELETTRVMARGSELHAVHEGKWYRLSMGDLGLQS